MKICSCCRVEKEAEDFQKRKLSKDGLTASCKGCLIKRDRARYPKEREKRAETCKLYAATEKGRLVGNKAKYKWSSLNTIRRGASRIVGNAVRDGKLIKEYKCQECGVENVVIHGHHDDYNYPMVVRWLCAECHTLWHKENGSGING